MNQFELNLSYRNGETYVDFGIPDFLNKLEFLSDPINDMVFTYFVDKSKEFLENTPELSRIDLGPAELVKLETGQILFRHPTDQVEKKLPRNIREIDDEQEAFIKNLITKSFQVLDDPESSYVVIPEYDIAIFKNEDGIVDIIIAGP